MQTFMVPRQYMGWSFAEVNPNHRSQAQITLLCLQDQQVFSQQRQGVASCAQWARLGL